MKIIPQCGHEQKLKCGENEKKAICEYPVIVDLPCGHHETVECHLKDSNLSEIKCKRKCLTTLDCSHRCQGDCYSCSGVSIMLTILSCFIFHSFRAICTKCVQRFVGSCWCVDTYAGRSVDSSVCALLNVRHSALTITVGRYNSYYHSHNSIIFPLSRVAVNLVRHVMSLVAGSVRIRVVKTFAVSLVQHLPALYPALRY